MRTPRALLPAVSALTALLSGAACWPEQCKTDSASLEVRITFSGFGLANARRVEFETEIDAIDPTTNKQYLERRLGSVSYPGGLGASEIAYLIDPGTYVRNLGEPVSSFRVFVRVYGVATGPDNVNHEDALLAEGYKRWGGLSATECYINQAMKVTGAPTCANKLEGDPCVSPSSGWQPRGVCMDSGGTLECRPSRCGDGFTDRRGGEACDPGEPADPSRGCATGCFGAPKTATLAPTGSTPAGIVAGAALQSDNQHLTDAPEFYSLGAVDSGDLQGSLVVADLDGDGADELMLGLAGAPYDHTTGSPNQSCAGSQVGVVYGYDWSLTGTKRYGSAEQGPPLRINGPCATENPSGGFFGAALAVGDLDGDGVMDLVVGAPRADGNARSDVADGGRVYVLFGGNRGAIPVGITAQLDVDQTGFPMQTFLGENGEWNAGSPGEWLGYAVAVADFDLDGYADLAVAAPQIKAPTLTRRGGVFLLRGGPDFRETAAQAVALEGIATLKITTGTDRSGERLGVSLATGDVNGDGYPDLVMGTTTGDATHLGGIAVLFGNAQVFDRQDGESAVTAFPFAGSRNGDLLVLDVAAQGLETSLLGLGGTVAVVDLDGDGRAEVAATLGRAPFGDAPGAVALLRGTYFASQYGPGRSLHSEADVTPPDDTEVTLVTGPTDADFGLTLAAVDANGDRQPDLLIGAPGEAYEAPPAAPVPEAGAVYVLFASPSEQAGWFSPEGTGTLDLVSLREVPVGADVPATLIWLRGTTPGGRFGTAMAGSSHLTQTEYELAYRNAYTYVFEPGQPSAPTPGPSGGRLYSLFVPALLPCESQAACVPRHR